MIAKLAESKNTK